MTVYKVISGDNEFNVAITRGELLLISEGSHAYYRGITQPINPNNGDRWDVVNSENLLVDIREYRVNQWVSLLPFLTGVESTMIDLLTDIYNSISLVNNPVTDSIQYSLIVGLEPTIIAQNRINRVLLIIQNIGFEDVFISFSDNNPSTETGLIIKPNGIFQTQLNLKVNAIAYTLSELRISDIYRSVQ